MTVKLADEWTPPRDAEGRLLARGKLWEFADLISQSRREGKNRRDGKTVQTRVLGLADKVGAELFEAADVAKNKAAGQSSEKDMVKTKRRRRGIMETRARL